MQEIYCNSNSAYTYFFCMFVTFGRAAAETVSAIEVEAGSAILIEANSGKFYMKKMQMNHWQLLV
ncbi:hypothetical protein ACT7DF_25100 [Bacillus cereus]